MSSARRSPAPAASPRDVLGASVCAAALAAGAELGALAIQKYVLGQFVHHAGTHLLWMVPLSNLLWIAPVVATSAAVHAWKPRFLPLSRAVALATLLAWFGFFVVGRNRLHILAIWVLAAGAATQTGLLVERYRHRMRGILRVAVPAVLAWAPVAAVVVLVGQRVREARAFDRRPVVASAEAPNIIIVLLDTVRDFSLSLSGDGRETSPGLASLAREGTLFTSAFAPSNWTPPSHASLFTGRWPHEFTRLARQGMGPEFPTLAEFFASRGYVTAGFSANVIVNRESGLTRGFTHFEDFPNSLAQVVNGCNLGRAMLRWQPLRTAIGLRDMPGRRYTDDMHRRVVEWLDAGPRGPYFLFVNLFDAHAPYVPPPPFDTLFNAEGRGRQPALVEQLTLDDIPTEIVAAERDAYEGSIAFMDRELTRFLAGLRERAIGRNDILVITSDHGEEFGEHGATGHGHTMYRELLQVPLLIVAPGRVPAGLRVDTPVSIADLAATLTDLAAMRDADFPGGSLRGLWGDTAAVAARAPRPPYASWNRSASVIVGGFHFIRTDDGGEELYEMASDREERRNLAGDPAYAAWLQRGRAVIDSIQHGAGVVTGAGR
ncbi:MAG TPA: sulfatase [Gemmatimonadaceae bacterium]|nr:sulfatase [Gemmatimonadaceae bacterium]